jgi:hypothetical protein
MRNTSKKKRESHVIKRNKRGLVEVKAICLAAYFNSIYRCCHQSPTIKYMYCIAKRKLEKEYSPMDSFFLSQDALNPSQTFFASPITVIPLGSMLS